MREHELGFFTTVIVDELIQQVKYGPSLDGEWVRFDHWGAKEWDVFLAIVSHPSGAAEHDVIRQSHGKAVVDRKVINRIRKRFASKSEIPPRYAADVIITKRGTSTYILNPRLKVRVVPGRQIGQAEHGEAMALDSIIYAIKRAGLELFGEEGLQQAVARLPDDVRMNTIEMRYPPGRWVPVRYIASWIRAMIDGPMGGSLAGYYQFLRRMEHHRLSPFFLDYYRSARHHRLANIGEMWRTCYNSGEIEAAVSPNGDWFEIRLWNHPYCHSEPARRTHALCWLALAEELGAKDCRLVAAGIEATTGAFRIRIEGNLFGSILVAP